MQAEPQKVHRKECRRENIPGHAHFLTFSCFQRRRFLIKDRTRKWLVESIAIAMETHRVDLWAYVIMPEHVHLVVFPREEQYDIGAILKSIKQPVAKRAVNFVRDEAPEFARHMEERRPNGDRSLRFWQRGGGYDRNLYSDGEVWEKIQYIHGNPVKRGLVGTEIEFLWSSAADFAGIRSGPLDLNWENLPRE